MTHIWVRAEQRENEERVGITPEGVAALCAAGFRITVEESHCRAIPIDPYREAGAAIAPESSWPDAPRDAIIFGLKELPDDGTPLPHRHIMFGHAYKGQFSGKTLLKRFRAGGGTLYDLEYLVDENGRRVAAFGYWAGFAGAAVTVKSWAAQKRGELCGPVAVHRNKNTLISELKQELNDLNLALPTALIIGALGRVGTGAGDLLDALGCSVTRWDMAETASGGPFPEVLDHDLFINCILARPGTPVFVPQDAKAAARQLSVVGDVACDPDSDYNPVPLYDRATTWEQPAIRVHENPALDVTAIDNLPSLLPRESSTDFADQLLPSLLTLNDVTNGVWGRAGAVFEDHSKTP